MQKQRSINLDLLRVIAIVSVIFYHAKLNIPYISFINGYLGVDIFFSIRISTNYYLQKRR